MKRLFLLLFLAAAMNVYAQTTIDTTLEAVPLRETVISATRSSQARSAVAQQVKVLAKNEIETLNAQSTADLIQNSGAAFVQKSQQGGGSHGGVAGVQPDDGFAAEVHGGADHRGHERVTRAHAVPYLSRLMTHTHLRAMGGDQRSIPSEGEHHDSSTSREESADRRWRHACRAHDRT